MDKDKIQQPPTTTDPNINFESKNIKKVDNKKLFTRTKLPWYKSALASIGKFFKTLWGFLKRHRITRLIIIILIIAIPMAIWALIRLLVPRDIMIGDIPITQKEIDIYADEMRQYKELNPDVVLNDPVEFATDNLIMNAALRHYASNDCKDLNANLNTIREEYPDTKSFYLRIPAENDYLERKLSSCLIADKTVFTIYINFDSPYFNLLSPEARSKAYAEAKQKLNDDYMPLFGKGLSVGEISAQADVDVMNPENGKYTGESYELWFDQMVVESNMYACMGDAIDCLNDTDVDYEVDPGQIFSMSEKIQSLDEVGDFTEVFVAKNGTFTIMRLESKTNGEFNSFEDLLVSTKEKYIKTDVLSKLFASLSDNIFSTYEAYATKLLDTSNYTCGSHTFKVNFQAVDINTGLALNGWKVYLSQDPGTNNCRKAFNGNYGPDAGDITPALKFITDCNAGAINIATSNKASAFFVDSATNRLLIQDFVSYPSDWTPKYQMWTPFGSYYSTKIKDDCLPNDKGWACFDRFTWRQANTTDGSNGGVSTKNKKLRWQTSSVNIAEEVNMYLVFEGQKITKTGIFYSQSGVAIEGVNNNAIAYQDLTRYIQVPSTQSAGPTVGVKFEHRLSYDDSDSGTNPGVTTSYTISSSGDTSYNNSRGPTSVFARYLPGNGNFQAVSSGNESGFKYVTLPKPPADQTRTYEICETISYQPRSYQGSGSGNDSALDIHYTSQNDSGSSRACAKITVKTVLTPVATCNNNNPGVLYDGRTTGYSGVRKNTSASFNNRTSDNPWSETAPALFAKPTDKIQFIHVLCPGARGVQEIENWASNPNTYSISGTTYPMSNPSAINRDNNYLFNLPSSTSGGVAYTGTLYATDYTGAVTKHSPDGNYKTCGTSFYTIPGNAQSCKPIDRSDVGKTISQSLTFANIIAIFNDHKAYNLGNVVKEAQVKIPFNYTTNPEVSNNVPEVVYGGGDTNINVNIDIIPRTNPGVDPNSPNYATITKPTTYEVVAFTTDSNTSYNGIRHKGPGSGDKNTPACNYFGYNTTDCKTIERSEKTFNGSINSINGSNDEGVFGGSIAIPDAEVGTKFCVAVGIWPSDSHDLPNGNVPAGAPAGAGDIALKSGESNSWSYSEPVCRTIAKKPNVQFHSSGIYTSNNVKTSQSQKAIGYTALGPNGNLLSNQVQSGSRRIFGSWSEYEAIALRSTSGDSTIGTITGFASGAAFGYDRNNGGALKANSPSSNEAFIVSHGATPTKCTYSTQTFNNDNCNETVGQSMISSIGNTVLNRLISRYTSDTLPATQSGTIDTEGSCTLQTNGTYQSSNPSKYHCLSNGAKYIKVNGNATLPAQCLNKGQSTSIIDVSGNLTIGGNIMYGLGNGINCASDTYHNLSELPQQIIFAKNINIRGDVENIDSWLVAGQQSNTPDKDSSKDQTDGAINTCNDIEGVDASDTSKSYPKNFSAAVCAKKLTINGPTFAKRLILNRTAGAGIYTESINPAEVFNLRVDAYLWAYSQAQRFPQAVTTYSRELAPRY